MPCGLLWGNSEQLSLNSEEERLCETSDNVDERGGGVGPAGSRNADAGRGSHRLQDYCSKPDATYKWVKRHERKLGDVTVTELTLTSQTWRDIVWKHQLYIFKPAELDNSKQALMLISGGSWKASLEGPLAEGENNLPSEATVMAGVVRQFKAPVVLLSHVPFQPVFGGMTEDEIISYTFEQYLKSEDAEWPLLFPMVKSAMRAMDAVQEFAQQEWDIEVENFTVTGASKRGWTTWLTGAADPRATAIAPIVIDTLNMEAQMKHQLESWGKYSEQIQDYTNRGIQQHFDTPAGRALNAMVDPYSYRDRIVQPKLLIIGTNDRYWVLDALNLYWDDLEGEKYILYVPNNGHGVNDFGRLLGTIGNFHRKAAGQIEFPKLSWNLTENEGKLALAVESDQQPKQVMAWVATAPTRDFREVKWQSYPAELVDGEYRYSIDVPAEGYAATFGEAVYATDTLPYYLSTNVKIVGTKPAAVATAGN